MADVTAAPEDTKKQADRRPLLRTAQAAHYCGMGKSVFDRMRLRDEGPAWIRLGAKIVAYDPDDLDAWAAANKRRPMKGR